MHSRFLMKTRSALTFRELRNFRVLHISQKINQSGYAEINSPSTLTYSFFGNAEAISPAQRRRFRESQSTLQESSKTSIEHSSRRKVSIFPTKRAKSIYAFSGFSGIRSLLKGITLYTSIKTSIPQLDQLGRNKVNNQQTTPLAFSYDSQIKFSKGIQRVNSLENTFHLLPTFRLSESVEDAQSKKLFARSFAYYKKLRGRTQQLDSEGVVGIHLSFLNSLFYSIEGVIDVQKTTKS